MLSYCNFGPVDPTQALTTPDIMMTTKAPTIVPGAGGRACCVPAPPSRPAARSLVLRRFG